MFTKEHYTAVAKVLKNADIPNNSIGRTTFYRISLGFVELFRENPKFDAEKFLDVIYGKGATKP